MAVTTPPNAAIEFFSELINRLFAKSPKFFKIFQIVSGLVALVAGLPALLDSLHVVLPAALSALESKVVGVAGVVALFISLLTVDRSEPSTPVVGPTALPLTDKAEAKKDA